MYSYKKKTEAISARLAPGLKDRIDLEVSQYYAQNRNKFINQACKLMLELRHDIRCGNVKMEDLPPNLWRFFQFLG